VLFGLFDPLLALVHAPRAEALLLLEPYRRGLDLSLAADDYLQRAFDAEEAVLCFCRHWSSRANGTRPDIIARSSITASDLDRGLDPVVQRDPDFF